MWWYRLFCGSCVSSKQSSVESHSQRIEAVDHLISDAVRGDDEQRQAKETVQDAEDTAACSQRRSVAVAWITYCYRQHASRHRDVSGVVYNFGGICLSVCLSVCMYVLCQTITFESLHVGSSYLHIRCISWEYGPSSFMKVIGSRSRSRSGAKKVATACSCINQLPSAIFIGRPTRQMAPQITLKNKKQSCSVVP